MTPVKYLHLHDTGRSFGPMEHIMDTSQIGNVGKLLNSMEKFYIYSETVKSKEINEESTTESNKI